MDRAPLAGNRLHLKFKTDRGVTILCSHDALLTDRVRVCQFLVAIRDAALGKPDVVIPPLVGTIATQFVPSSDPVAIALSVVRQGPKLLPFVHEYPTGCRTTRPASMWFDIDTTTPGWTVLSRLLLEGNAEEVRDLMPLDEALTFELDLAASMAAMASLAR